MPTPTAPDAVITIVHSAGCHFCEDARAALADLGGEYRLRVEYLDATGTAGRELQAHFRVPMFPLVLVDGQFFSYGRLPRRKLRGLLATRLRQTPHPAGVR